MIYAVVRHGETELNIRNIVQGKSDNGLCVKGFSTAETYAENLRILNVEFDCVVCSPLRRCTETAGIISEKLSKRVRILENLTELSRGEHHGLNKANASKTKLESYKRFCEHPYTMPPKHGESFIDLSIRLNRYVIPKLQTFGQVIIVTHGFVGATLCKLLDPRILPASQISLKQGKIYLVENIKASNEVSSDLLQ